MENAEAMYMEPVPSPPNVQALVDEVMRLSAEIDALKEANEELADGVADRDRLAAENARLREAVERLINDIWWRDDMVGDDEHASCLVGKEVVNALRSLVEAPR